MSQVRIFQINRYGIPVENKASECVQIMTCSPDENVMIWDTRPPKTAAPQTAKEQVFTSIRY